MADLPTGTLTLLFTDIEGSTRLLQALGPRYTALLADHHAILRAAIEAGDGIEVQTEGDAFFAVFRTAVGALSAAVQAQRELARHAWPDGVSVRVRMGIHTGEIELSGGQYIGLDIHRAARVMAAAHGGQVLITAVTGDLVGAGLPHGATVRDLGEHRLKDLERSEHLLQLVIEDLPSVFPPLRSLTSRFDILPRPLTTFVGRSREVARIVELMGTTRLLTLTGPGGTGKTRLAIESARQLADSFEDGAAFVPLAAIRDPQLVGSTIRQTLGIAEEPSSPGVETVIQRLAAQDVLLVLDNMEQLLGAAGTVARLLEGTENLRILVTSRAPLHITGEQEFPVPPLGLPELADRDNPDVVSQSEAVALFVQRARTIRPDFAPTAANARVIVEICERLDGLPLAIELAASRIRMLPPESLLARLSRSLDLLQSTAVDRTDRQRTLRGAIDWSHDLLDEAERAVFRRVAIFVGGFELEAAEEIAAAAGPLDGDMLGNLSSLVEHSLVRQVETEGEPRFTLLETIREYGLERLGGAGEMPAAARAHGSRYLALTKRLAAEFTRNEAALETAEREHDNIRAALRWARDAKEFELALEAVGALWRFWHLRGHLREGERVARQTLEQAPETATHGRARALYGLGSLVYWNGDYAGAADAYNGALRMAETIGDDATIAEAHYAIGFIHLIAKDYDAARREYDASRDVAQHLGDDLALANAIFGSAFVDAISGPYEAGYAKLIEAIPLYERIGDRFGMLNAYGVLGRTLQVLGRRDEARIEHLRELDGSLEIGDRTMTSMAFHDLAAILVREGRISEGLRLEGASRAIVEELGAGAPTALVTTTDPIEDAHAAGVGQDAIDRLIDEGRRMPADDAVALARIG